MDCKLENRDRSGLMPYEADTISLDGGHLSISFHRTIRVPDNSTTESFLPPDLGAFPLFPAREVKCRPNCYSRTEVAFPSQLPEWLKNKGGVFFPMHENEATWIKFKSNSNRPYAIKVYAGGVNAVSGRASIVSALSGQQDYVVIPEQQWLDGIAVKAGLVRQFVAVPHGKNRTIEGQMTGSEKYGGLQFEVVAGNVWKYFRVHSDTHTEITVSMDGREDVNELCRLISEKLGKTLGVDDLYDTRTRESLTIYLNKRLRETSLTEIGIFDAENPPLPLQGISSWGGGYMSHCRYSGEYSSFRYGQAYSLSAKPLEVGLAAGGLIKQHIQEDTHPASTWDLATKTVFNVQLLSAGTFEDMTGFMAPVAPINAATYLKYNLSFFDIPELPSEVTGDFGGLKSLAHLMYLDERENRDIMLASASDGGEFRFVNEYRHQEDDSSRQRLTSAQMKTAHTPMLRRDTRLELQTHDSFQYSSTMGRAREHAYIVSSTISQEGANAQDSDFYPDFDDEVTEIPGLPFGSSEQDVWSRISGRT